MTSKKTNPATGIPHPEGDTTPTENTVGTGILIILSEIPADMADRILETEIAEIPEGVTATTTLTGIAMNGKRGIVPMGIDVGSSTPGTPTGTEKDTGARTTILSGGATAVLRRKGATAAIPRRTEATLREVHRTWMASAPWLGRQSRPTWPNTGYGSRTQ